MKKYLASQEVSNGLLYTTKPLNELSLSEIAMEVRRDWKKVNFGAKPYLDAMATLQSVDDNYILDSGRSIVMYFLSNASTWRGETAKAVKKELKKRLS
jgi:hypothetical protein